MDPLPAAPTGSAALVMQARPDTMVAFEPLPGAGLPIYAATRDDYAIFYTPRLVCILSAEKAFAARRHIIHLARERQDQASPKLTPRSNARQVADRIVRAAREAVREDAEISRQKFTAECLTIYMNNWCNLRCHYCYSRPTPNPGRTPSEQGIRAAAALVGGMCAHRGKTMMVAFHGGGEPTLDRPKIDRFLTISGEEAMRFGIDLKTYIATNGVVSVETARWLADRFDYVGVSCDGPPDIQDRHRPSNRGQLLSTLVYRTMATLQQQGRPFTVRTTVTQDTLDHQADIVEYFHKNFAPSEIRLEPVYSNASGELSLDLRQADDFVNGLVEAQAAGQASGLAVTTSITRPDSIYGRYCNVLRRVINIIPGDVATACFRYSRASDLDQRGLKVGTFNTVAGRLNLDSACIQRLITLCSARPSACTGCLCNHQCTYGCPDVCPLETSANSALQECGKRSFRCQVNRMLLERNIHDAAERAWACTSPGHSQDVGDALSRLRVAVYRDAGGREGCS